VCHPALYPNAYPYTVARTTANVNGQSRTIAKPLRGKAMIVQGNSGERGGRLRSVADASSADSLSAICLRKPLMRKG